MVSLDDEMNRPSNWDVIALAGTDSQMIAIKF